MNPLRIDKFNISLDKLETICNLLDKRYHKRVRSLTLEEVKELDAIAEKLGLDHECSKYLERSMMNTQVPLTVRA